MNVLKVCRRLLDEGHALDVWDPEELYWMKRNVTDLGTIKVFVDAFEWLNIRCSDKSLTMAMMWDEGVPEVVDYSYPVDKEDPLRDYYDN